MNRDQALDLVAPRSDRLLCNTKCGDTLRVYGYTFSILARIDCSVTLLYVRRVHVSTRSFSILARIDCSVTTLCYK